MKMKNLNLQPIDEKCSRPLLVEDDEINATKEKLGLGMISHEQGVPNQISIGMAKGF